MAIFKKPRLGYPLTPLDVKNLQDVVDNFMFKVFGNIEFGDLSKDFKSVINNKVDIAELQNYVTSTILESSLSGLVTVTDLTNALSNYITNGTFSDILARYVTDSALTTKLGQDFIITGKILANQIAAGLLLGVSIKTSNTVNYVQLENQYLSMWRSSQKKVELGYNDTTGRMELTFINDAGAAARLYTRGDGYLHCDTSFNILHNLGTFAFQKGNYDGANWGSHNSRINGWFGLAIGSDYTGSFDPKFMFDCRSGTLSCLGPIYGTSKSNVTETEEFGEVITYADESPNHVHVDRGVGELDENGQCVISLDPMWLSTVNTKSADYWVQLTGFKGANVEIEELFPDFFVVCGNAGKKFNWRVEAERKGYERLRFNEGAIDY